MVFHTTSVNTSNYGFKKSGHNFYTKKLLYRRQTCAQRTYYKRGFYNLLHTASFAQSTSQYYFVRQSLHKARPNNTLYIKTCSKYVPILLCTKKLKQSASRYYCILQRLHKACPSARRPCDKRKTGSAGFLR